VKRSALAHDKAGEQQAEKRDRRKPMNTSLRSGEALDPVRHLISVTRMGAGDNRAA